MCILLVLIVELLLEFRNDALHLKRCNAFLGVEPELLHELGKPYRQLALGAQWILVVDLALEVASEEVLGKANRMG